MQKQRTVRKQNGEKINEYCRKYRISETAARVLYNRVGNDVSAADCFFSATPFEFFDPFLLDGMETAAERLNRAIEKREKIVVYGDYDVDGITSVSLMLKYLSSKGIEAGYYIPDREGEGYGMNVAALKKIREQGAELIITVDNGITAISEIEEGIKLGLDFIVTDHHECGGEIPGASAVINPKISKGYPFRELAGVGVAFKLICAVEGKGSEREILKKYGEIIAIGTIADVVPLLSENREIAKIGLNKMNRGDVCPGIASLIDMLNKNGRTLTSQTVGYMISPRINAAGRMGTTENAVRLFMAKNAEEGYRYANILCEENKTRQDTEQNIMREAEEALKSQVDLKNDKVMVISGKGWHQGVIGIIASRLTERYYLPAILISEENGSAKGSGRSIEGFNLFEALSANSEHLEKFGGHELAAGLSLKAENIDAFRRAINEYAKDKMTEDILVLKITADCELTLSEADLNLCRELMRFEPTGTANTQPLFYLKDVTVRSVMPLSNRKFARITVTDGKRETAAVCFEMPYDSIICAAGDRVNIIASLNENIFRERSSVQLTVKDIELVSGNKEPDISALCREDVPTTDELRIAVKYFKQRIKEGTELFGLSSLAEHISCESGIMLTPVKAFIAVDIFNELGIIKSEKRDGGLFVSESNFNGTVSLTDSALYRRIKEVSRNA